MRMKRYLTVIQSEVRFLTTNTFLIERKCAITVDYVRNKKQKILNQMITQKQIFLKFCTLEMKFRNYIN